MPTIAWQGKHKFRFPVKIYFNKKFKSYMRQKLLCDFVLWRVHGLQWGEITKGLLFLPVYGPIVFIGSTNRFKPILPRHQPAG